jgi:hypothetical protein
MPAIAKETVVVEWLLKKKQFDKQVTNMRKSINKTKNGLRVASKDVTDAMDSMQKESFRGQRNVLMSGLSLMFFFRQLNMQLTGIAKNAFNTFNKMTANTELANNSINRLAVGMDAVKFTLGSAFSDVLEPMMPTILSFLESVIDFIDQHPKLTVWSAGIAILTTGLLAFIGSLSLLFNGLTKLSLASAFTTIATKIYGWGAAIIFSQKKLGAILSSLGKIAKAAVIKFAVGGKGLTTAIINTSTLLAKWALLAAIIIAITGLLFGDKSVTKWTKTAIIGLSTFIAWIMFQIERIVKTANTMGKFFNLKIKEMFSKAKATVVNMWVDAINKVIRAYNSTAGKLLGTIGTISISTDVADYTEEIKALQTNLNRYYNGERWEDWKASARNVGETFDVGMKEMTDAIGFTKAGEARSDYLGDFMNALTGNQQAITDQLEAANLQKEAAESTIYTNNFLVDAISSNNTNMTSASNSSGSITGATFTFLAPTT